MAKKIDVKNLLRRYEDAWTDVSEWIADAGDLIDFVAPGRGVTDRHNKPKKRELTSKKLINGTASEAITIFSSGVHGRLTGPSRQWFRAKFEEETPAGEVLKRWMNDCVRRLHRGFHRSNFYEQMPGFYEEWGAFGTASMSHSDDAKNVFKFNLLTYGEFVFTLKANGDLDYYFRDIWLTARQMEKLYGTKNLPTSIQQKLKDKKDDNTFYKIVQVVFEQPYMDKDFTSVHIFHTRPNNSNSNSVHDKPLKVGGNYEHPFSISRYSVIGSDAFGIGLGSKILNDSKRLQEMEKALLMATHKAVAPAVNAPSHLKNRVQLRPDGINYMSSTGQKVETIENRGFEYNGVAASVERIEKRIGKACFNDVFLTGMRDPNASPLKATQVNRMEDEEIIRLGPAVGRVSSEHIVPIVRWAFNSMMRRGLFAEIDPALLEEAGNFQIEMIGPLAQMQKLIEARSIQTFFQFVGGVIQFDESVRDKINSDASIDEFADITGVPLTVLNDETKVQGIRDTRQKAIAAQQQQQQQIQQQGMSLQAEKEKSEIAKNYADANESSQGGMAQGMM